MIWKITPTIYMRQSLHADKVGHWEQDPILTYVLNSAYINKNLW